MIDMKPLSRAFACRSELARRGVADVPTDEALRELRDELDKRQRVYPANVAKGTMKQDEAMRFIAIWRAIIADWNGADGTAFGWEAKVRELRRELAIRRAAYPKWVSVKTHPLNAAEAARKLECLDAVHWRYWGALFAFTPGATDRFDDPARFAFIARMEAAELRDAQRRHSDQPDLMDGAAAQDDARRIAQAISAWEATARLADINRDVRGGTTCAGFDPSLLTQLSKSICAIEDQTLADAQRGAISQQRAKHVHEVSVWLEGFAARLGTAPVNQERKAA